MSRESCCWAVLREVWNAVTVESKVLLLPIQGKYILTVTSHKRIKSLAILTVFLELNAWALWLATDFAK